eukprot:3218029-Amphidinium_carterae.2
MLWDWSTYCVSASSTVWHWDLDPQALADVTRACVNVQAKPKFSLTTGKKLYRNSSRKQHVNDGTMSAVKAFCISEKGIGGAPPKSGIQVMRAVGRQVPFKNGFQGTLPESGIQLMHAVSFEGERHQRSAAYFAREACNQVK